MYRYGTLSVNDSIQKRISHSAVIDARDPSLNVVLLEDSAAIMGVFIALGAISLSSITLSPFYDSVGSILIGTLLGSVASFIIKANSQHLVGRSIPLEKKQQLIEMLRQDSVVKLDSLCAFFPLTPSTFSEVHDVKATIIGPDEVRLKAEIDFCGAEITKAYLSDVDLEHELDVVKQVRSCSIRSSKNPKSQIKNKQDLVNFLVRHGTGITDRTGVEVDRVESQIKVRRGQ